MFLFYIKYSETSHKFMWGIAQIHVIFLKEPRDYKGESGNY